MTLTVENLACRRGERLIFRDLSFQLDTGAMLGLAGYNGTGKSSLLAILAGLLPGETGSISISRPSSDSRPLDAQDILWLGPRIAFYSHLSVYDNLLFWARLNGFTPNDVKMALNHFQLSEQQALPVNHLSRGQLQRAWLCRLYFSRSRLWLVDEPLTGLDSNGQALFKSMVENFLQQGGMVITAPVLAGWQTYIINLEDFQYNAQQPAMI